MATPTTSAVLKDPNNIPIPQWWDPVSSGWVAYVGINTFSIGAYTFGAQALSSAGWFRGAVGQYNGTSTAIWVMVFDHIGAPATLTPPLYATAVGPASSGLDTNWYIAPATPMAARYVTSGIYIAISTTGGTFTASANANLTGTVEFYAAGT